MELSTAQTWQEAWFNSQDNPYLFATKVLGFLPFGADNPNNTHQLEKWQDELLRNFMLDASGTWTKSPKHSIRSGHGVGKGMVLAILSIWFVLTHYDAKAVITANSQDQLRDNNWPELKKVARFLPEALRDQLQIDEERAYVKAEPEMSFLVRRTASKSNPEALQGLRGQHTLYLIDEASGIPDIVFEIAQGAMSTENAMAVLMSNPTKARGFFHLTHTKLRNRWRTMRVSSEDVPRARGHIEDIRQTYGADSNRFRVRVLGEFPTADDDTIIPIEALEAARDRDVAIFNVAPVWGVDVARFGDDASALAKRQGNHLLEPTKEWRQKDLMQFSGIIHDEWNRTPEKDRPVSINIDEIGLGAGLVDILKRQNLPVYGVNVSERASQDTKYARLRDELWFKGRDWFLARNVRIPADEELISELSGPTYEFNSSGQILAERKKDLKLRGLQSPNRADAFLNTFARPDRERKKEQPYRVNARRASAWAA